MPEQKSKLFTDKNKTLLRHWREKGRKRTANEAFLKTADALVDLDLSPRIKREVRRPPYALTIHVRRESEKEIKILNKRLRVI